MKRNVGIELMVVGILLITLAYINAASIPSRANSDYQKFLGSPDSKSCFEEYTSPNPMHFYNAQVSRRLLQNAYLGTAGIVFLAGGLAMIVKSNRQNLPAS